MTKKDTTPLSATVAAKVNAFITENAPNKYCDACLTEELNLTRSQHVQQITQALGTTSDFIRDDGFCDICGEDRKVIERA